MTEIVNHFALGLMLIGLIFVLVAAIGIVKFPDIYTRLHAATKGVTFGFAFLVLGAAILLQKDGSDMTKALAAILFQILVAPVTGHMIGRVAMRKGLRVVKNPKGEFHDTPEPVADSRSSADSARP